MASHGQALPRKAGHIDTSFGDGGSVTLSLPDALGGAGLAFNEDATKILVGMFNRRIESDSNEMYAVGRIHRDGQIDESFGEHGVALSSPWLLSFNRFGTRPLPWTAGSALVTVLSNGRGGPAFYGVGAFLENGEPDESFGYYGLYSPSLVAGMSIVHLAIAHADEKRVLLVCFGEVEGKSSLLLVQLTAQGKLDTGFHGTGWLIRPYPSFAGDKIVGAALQADGKLVVCSMGTGQTPPLLRRYDLTQGELDPTFGTGGSIEIRYPGGTPESYAFIEQLVLLPDGAIRLAGHWYDPTMDLMRRASGLLVALDHDGQLDTTWNGTGYVRFIQTNGLIRFSSLGVDSEARWVVMGSETLETDPRKARDSKAARLHYTLQENVPPDAPHAFISNDVLMRYLPNGVLDASFGDGGYVTLEQTPTALSAQTTLSMIDAERNRLLIAGIDESGYEAIITAYVI